jgi:riboflavin kinase/FMN adenylyltransferase
VRENLRNGRVSRAGRLLGRPFELTGAICQGTGTGSRHVFPTLNITREQEILPANGVYATQCVLPGFGVASPLPQRALPGVTNIGVRPTFNGQRLTIETHLLDFAEQITDGRMVVQFFWRLRDEMKFSGPETLRRQIERDISRARKYFRRIPHMQQISLSR